MLEVEPSIATPLEHFEFVVQVFNNSAIISVDEIVEDFFPPAAQGVDELVRAAQLTFCDPLDPGFDFGFGRNWGDWLIENGGQLLLQVISLFQ
jgi:hypothetical protein